MKCLPSISTFGLLLSCITVSLRPEDDVIKLCDPDLKENLIELCQGSKAGVHHSNSASQDSGETDYYTDMYLKIQAMYDKYGFQQIAPNLGEHLSYGDYRQHDLMTEDIKDFVSKSAQQNKKQSVNPRKSIPSELNKRQALDKCCKTGCTINEILSELCWKK